MIDSYEPQVHLLDTAIANVGLLQPLHSRHLFLRRRALCLNVLRCFIHTTRGQAKVVGNDGSKNVF